MKIRLSLCLLMLGATVATQAQPWLVDQIVAIVGSRPIKLSDVKQAYMYQRMQGIPMYAGIECELFEGLLQQKLLANQAQVDSVKVDYSNVETQINTRFRYLLKDKGSEKAIEEQYHKTIAEMKDDMRPGFNEQAEAMAMQREIINNVKVTPSDVRAFYYGLSKDSIPLVNGQAEIAQIVLDPPYSTEIIDEVKQKLLDLRKRVLNGENFRTLAVLYSEDGSARNGGDLGYINMSEFDPTFVKAAKALKNPGDVSRIIETKFGYHLIQLVGKRGTDVNCRHIIITPKPDPAAVEKVTARLDSIASLIKDKKIDWNTAALYYSMDENTRFNGGVMINPTDNSTRFEMSQLPKADYDVIKNLKVGEISKVYQSVNEKGKTVFKIVKINSLTDPHRANLKDDYAFLQQMTSNEKMQKVLQKWLSDKIATSYIYIDDRYRQCKFMNTNWLK